MEVNQKDIGPNQNELKLLNASLHVEKKNNLIDKQTNRMNR